MGIVKQMTVTNNYTQDQYEMATTKLREVGAIKVGINNLEYVEGEPLLDTCGYTYKELTVNNGVHREKSKATQMLKRQIDKHSFIEGTDYDTIQVKVGRTTKTIYRFTINAANHVLLAAMTEQGKLARQDAIDTKIAIQQFDTDPLIAQMQMMMTIRKDQLVHSEKLQVVEDKVAVLEHRLDTRSSFLGHILWTDAKRKYAPNLSDEMIKIVINLKAVPTKMQTVVVNGFESQTLAVHEVAFDNAITEFMSEITQVTNTQYVHPELGSKRFKA